MSLFNCKCGGKRSWKTFPGNSRITVCEEDQTHGLGERFIEYLETGHWNEHDKRSYFHNKNGKRRPAQIVDSYVPPWVVN